MKGKFLVLLIFVGLYSCNKKNEQLQISAETIGLITSQMTDVMVHDVTNPPLGARFFSYACLAGYEVVALNDSSIGSMHGILNAFPKIVRPDSIEAYSYQLSAALAMLETAKKMQPSGKVLLQKYQDHLLDSCRAIGFSETVIEGSGSYAIAVSKQILKYARADKYNLISNFPRYEPKGTAGTWYPTPPGYFPPVEPYFSTVRPFTLDSASQFKPIAPVAFSENRSSEFYKLMQTNHDVELNNERKLIAAFWDCNPFALDNKGHLLVGMKKISPGSHWMGITDIACRKANKNFSETMKINTAVAIGMMDSFMTCWDEKYRSNRIRPETAIRKYIDPTWTPFLQTPPFPEYLSGHSVVSSAVSEILTHYLGDHFEYIDTVEERFGLEARPFKSFKAAAEEAAISRFYGGIHFMDAIDVGVDQGTEVGHWVIKTLESKK
jgi:hypothetical protein